MPLNRKSFTLHSIWPSLNGVFNFYCATVAKEVEVRTRRVRLLRLQGAGKTSLFRAILGQSMLSSMNHVENLQIQSDVQDCIVGGVCYSDTLGLLQELQLEASRFREELWKGVRSLSKKIDLIIHVHNLSHRVPRYQNSTTQQLFALALSIAKPTHM